MAGPAKLPASPALELTAKQPFRLSQAALVGPGGKEVYRLASDYSRATNPDTLGEINKPLATVRKR